ncbi:MAG: alkaline phosphatase family protein [Armatimonadota bacterium]|nr:alkaline phosphatase family protein [Armatimonadota bacterium]
MGKVTALLAALAVLAVGSAVGAQQRPASRARHVLIISIDGARPDGLRVAGIGSILQEASASMTAQTTVPPTTASAHMSMVSGVGPEKHGVRDNTWRPGRPHPPVPTVFSVSKQAGLRTALFTQKPYVPVIADPRYMDRVELVPWRSATLTSDLIAAASAYIRSAKPHVVLAHISEPDAAGHADGWMSFAYLQALRRAVSGIGLLRQALREADIEEQTLVIITADHGGIDRDHVTTVPEVMTIPWIAQGSGVKQSLEIQRAIVIYDTAATVLYALGLDVPQGWDGKPLTEAFVTATPLPLRGAVARTPLAPPNRPQATPALTP